MGPVNRGSGSRGSTGAACRKNAHSSPSSSPAASASSFVCPHASMFTTRQNSRYDRFSHAAGRVAYASGQPTASNFAVVAAASALSIVTSYIGCGASSMSNASPRQEPESLKQERLGVLGAIFVV